MPASLPRRPSGSAKRFQLKSSHTSRLRLAVSHRGQAWTPPRKDDAAERDPKRGR
jgi:hypothetical protein